MRPLLTLLVIPAALLIGCGDSGPQDFDQDGFPFTFEYPEDLEVSTDVSFDSDLGAAADDTVAVGIDDSNGIVVQRFTLQVAIDEGNLDRAQAEFDRLIGDVDPDASSETGETAGLPSLTYGAIQVPNPPDGESRITVFFDGDQEYLINCQSTPEEREAINAACDQALETLAAT